MYFIEYDTDSDEENEESSDVKPSSVSVVAAGAEIDNEMDEEWETNESDFMYHGDDLLYGNDPLEMERFEFSWVKKKCLCFH